MLIGSDLSSQQQVNSQAGSDCAMNTDLGNLRRYFRTSFIAIVPWVRSVALFCLNVIQIAPSRTEFRERVVHPAVKF